MDDSDKIYSETFRELVAKRDARLHVSLMIPRQRQVELLQSLQQQLPVELAFRQTVAQRDQLLDQEVLKIPWLVEQALRRETGKIASRKFNFCAWIHEAIAPRNLLESRWVFACVLIAGFVFYVGLRKHGEPTSVSRSGPEQHELPVQITHARLSLRIGLEQLPILRTSLLAMDRNSTDDKSGAMAMRLDLPIETFLKDNEIGRIP